MPNFGFELTITCATPVFDIAVAATVAMAVAAPDADVAAGGMAVAAIPDKAVAAGGMAVAATLDTAVAAAGMVAASPVVGVCPPVFGTWPKPIGPQALRVSASILNA